MRDPVTGKEKGQYCRISHFKTMVEGWPYERLERVANEPGCSATNDDFMPDFRDENGNSVDRAINLIYRLKTSAIPVFLVGEFMELALYLLSINQSHLRSLPCSHWSV
jgi:hypothetical protein